MAEASNEVRADLLIEIQCEELPASYIAPALKAFEKKDRHLKAKAATNLSFVYYLEGDIAEADNYANMAVRYHRYNAKALVNKGNCYFVQGQYERAKELYLEAIGVEADCTESIFNLGLVNKRLGFLNDALQAFDKLHSIVPKLPEVIYQIANVHDMLDNHKASTDNFNTLLTQVPSDPGVHAKLGRVYNKRDDQTNAFHYHRESYRYFPVDLDVISWLGVWYVKQEFYEQAISYFERAAEIQPSEVKWKLMIASCYRRMANFQHAVDLYEEIHRQYPENQECLRYLIIISKELNIKYDHYQREYAKLERINTDNDFNPNAGAMTQMQNSNATSYPDAPKHRGITLFLIRMDDPGLEIHPTWTIGDERTNEVFFQDVFVSDDFVVGELNRGWTYICEALDLERLRVVASLPERELGRVEAGQGVRLVSAYDSEVGARGLVDRVAPVVDAASGTFRVTIAVEPGQTALRPGQFVSVVVEVGRNDDVLVVPKQAVVYEDGVPVVYTVVDAPEPEEDDAEGEGEADADAAGGSWWPFGGSEEAEEAEGDDEADAEEEGPKLVAERHVVKLGLIDDELGEIQTGVDEGDQVVTVGQSHLRDGARVRPVEREAADAEAEADAGAEEAG